mmetsp:Transcript_31552/g.62410  ORF Transcript_31552/g.62410 Transcript_31552/m.62410 type:complete len:91 (-) Transcript_31552:26-298(-)
MPLVHSLRGDKSSFGQPICVDPQRKQILAGRKNVEGKSGSFENPISRPATQMHALASKRLYGSNSPRQQPLKSTPLKSTPQCTTVFADSS